MNDWLRQLQHQRHGCLDFAWDPELSLFAVYFLPALY